MKSDLLLWRDTRYGAHIVLETIESIVRPKSCLCMYATQTLQPLAVTANSEFEKRASRMMTAA